MKRRVFLLAAAGTGAALVVGWSLLPDGSGRSRLGAALALPDGDVALNGWVKLGRDGRMSVLVPRSEMGQGVLTALPMLVAEELGLPLAALRVEQAPLGGAQDRIYGNVAMLTSGLPFHPQAIERDETLVRFAKSQTARLARQLGLVATGGSSSVADAWDAMRLAGAFARETLKAAAASKLGTDVAAVTLGADGAAAGGKTMSFAELAQAGADIARFVPQQVVLKPASAFTLIGTPAPRTDVPAKTDGSAVFGIDVRPPGLLYAAVRMCPTLGGSIATLDDKAARALPGVLRVEQLSAHHGGTAGVAVIGKTYWHAKQGADALNIGWSDGPNAAFDSSAWLDELARACREESGFAFHARGDVEAAFKRAAKTVEAEYRAPFLAHATMEPINCTAQLKDGKLSVWASTQIPSIARNAAAKAAGVSADAVTLQVQLLGGGFGRRLEADFIAQAAELARALSPQPVQLIWPREEDLTHDFYRPAQAAWLRAALDAEGKLTAWQVQSAGGAIVPQVLERTFGLPGGGPDKTTSEGLFDLPYGIANQRIGHVTKAPPVPIGFWRSVGHSMNAFFTETFVDEVAAAAGADPLAFRLQHLQDAPRHAAVLRLAAQQAGYGKALPAGHAHGIALAESFGSIVAQVHEVSLEGGKPRVHKVTVAIDCGTAVNPNIIAQQMESGVVFGLTAALYGNIDIKNGRVQQTNFPSYPLLALAQAPQVATHIVPSTRAPGGVGEPGTPPAAPALANALARLTGKRAHRLPLVV
jgi:isoquinoline 1-oxidoreductase beta subunit